MKICLVGNQNCGKTALFNELTGMNQKIGNWPGVTIDKKTGTIRGTQFEIIDLPGIYSLNPYTEEEKITVEYIKKEKPDIIVNVIDSTCLERSLYLTTELIELKTKVLVVLNMTDLLQKKGIKIDIPILKSELKTEVCEASALKKTGIDDIIKSIEKLSKLKYEKCYYCNKKCPYRLDNKKYEEMATKRYNDISRIIQKCLYKKKKWINITQNLDKILLNKILGFPIFALIIFSLYFLSIGIIGNLTSNYMTIIINKLYDYLQIILINLNAPNWLQSLFTHGILKGVSSVLSFIPQLITLFICISFLENTGYMSRIAFLLDESLSKIGLSGKAIIPFIVGTGCSVPGIMSTKILENSKERKKVSILVPFIPCSAKIPIIAFASSYFFKENAVIVSMSLYCLSFLVVIISSIGINKFSKNEEKSFISELPDYKIPSLKYIVREATEKTCLFIKRAGTTILISSIIIWLLVSFSKELKYGVDMENSILAEIGKKISWIFYPMIGINSWQASVSILQGLIAKEQVIASMSIVSGYEIMTKWSAYSFTVFNLFCTPCFAALATMKKELHSTKDFIIAIAYETITAWILSTLIYHVLLLLF